MVPLGLGWNQYGVSILQPYSASENRWFEGTSHAILQNIDYIDSINRNSLDSIWDHIYKMDYDDMLQALR